MCFAKIELNTGLNLIESFDVIFSADSGSDVISEALSKSPEFDLEEATRTIHVGGKWISFKSEETETTIVDVGMPNSGDFIKYFVWCMCIYFNSFFISKLHNSCILCQIYKNNEA